MAFKPCVVGPLNAARQVSHLAEDGRQRLSNACRSERGVGDIPSRHDPHVSNSLSRSSRSPMHVCSNLLGLRLGDFSINCACYRRLGVSCHRHRPLPRGTSRRPPWKGSRALGSDLRIAVHLKLQRTCRAGNDRRIASAPMMKILKNDGHGFSVIVDYPYQSPSVLIVCDVKRALSMPRASKVFFRLPWLIIAASMF